MESQHLFQSFVALLATVAFALIVATVLALFSHLNDALLILLTNTVTGCFALLKTSGPRSVRVDNPPDQPVPTEAQ